MNDRNLESVMSAMPPPPPLPPPPPVIPHKRNSLVDSPLVNNTGFIFPEICEWAAENTQLWDACAKYNICLYHKPFKYKYRHFESILQVGPTCGLVALAMLVEGKIPPEEILALAKSEGFTSQGEMLSCKNMLNLTKMVLKLVDKSNVSVSLKCSIYTNEIVEKLLDGAVLLVPYDADCNHSPCLRKGHTAHWALISGIVITEDPGVSYTTNSNNVYVFAKHGKSKYLTAWLLDALDKSNKNLFEFSPKKVADELDYVIPEGGISSENGLRNKFVLIEGLS